jgi:hypothetical protein
MIILRKYRGALFERKPGYVVLRLPSIEIHPDEEVLRLVAADTAADPSWELVRRSTWLGFNSMTATYVQRSVRDENLYRVRQASVSAQTVTTCAEFSWPEPLENVLCAFQGLAFVKTAIGDVIEVDAHHVVVSTLDCLRTAELFSVVSDKVVDVRQFVEPSYYLEDRRTRFAWIAGCVL